MPNPDPERDQSLHGEETPGPVPRVLTVSVWEENLEKIDSHVQERRGVSIYELAENDPRDAYVHIGYLVRDKFIDPKTEDWGIGSPEEDGQMAFDGLTRYMAGKTAPDPDIEVIDVVVSVWKRNGWLKRIWGKGHEVEEVMNFRVEPMDLAL